MPQNGLTLYQIETRDPGGMHPNAHLWDNGKDPNVATKNEGSSKSVIAIWRKQHSQRHTNGNA
jgi:hypothetical protein